MDGAAHSILRGETAIIFQTLAAGPIAIRAQGPAVRATISTISGSAPPRADGRMPAVSNLDPGFYRLRIEPLGDASGILDLTIARRGLCRTVAAICATHGHGLWCAEFPANTLHTLITGYGPAMLVGARFVSLPVDLSNGAVPLVQFAASDGVQSLAPAPAPRMTPPPANKPLPQPGAKPAANVQGAPAAKPPVASPAPAPVVAAPPPPPPPADLTLDVRAPVEGTIIVRDSANASVPFTLSAERVEKTQRFATLRIAAVGTTRALAVSWEPVKTTNPVNVAPPADILALSSGKPVFLDLKSDASRSLRTELPDGGLYRLETLGRLKTQLRIGTAFTPKLADATDNGAGHNALVQAYLRAGQYRIGVSAQESSGRAGVQIARAPLVATAPLADGGRVSASLDGGQGVVIPIDIASAGRYRLDLYAPGRDLRSRLEDKEGWPLAVPQRNAQIEREFVPGRVQLVVLPDEVDSRIIARLQKIVPAPVPEGHGPHVLPFGVAQNLQWREPQARDAARDPDVWTFSLAGEADVTLTIGEGMLGTLIRGANETVGKIIAKRGFEGKLAAGDYRVEARALARDDRLDYQITLNADQVQPDMPRRVGADDTIKFAIAEDRVVTLTTLGRTALDAVLTGKDDEVIERLSAGADGTVALSRRLPAGNYALELKPLGSTESKSTDNEGEGREASASSDDANADADNKRVEVRLSLPAVSVQPALTPQGSVQADGAKVSVFALPAIAAGQLALISAQASSDAVVSLEQRNGEGPWRVAASAQGRGPLLAWPSDGDARNQWRVSVWMCARRWRADCCCLACGCARCAKRR